MRAKISNLFIGCTIILLIGLLSCDDDSINYNYDHWLKGLWVSETSDSLCFSTFLFINNSHPYDYNIINDSLAIHPLWSSNNREYWSYKIDIYKSSDEICISSFLGKEKMYFTKQNNRCK